jgi:hypothetical protein
MRLHNIRFGFATNSSSTHSIVLVSPEQIKQYRRHGENSEFGWQDFVLTDKADKLKYAAVTYYENLKQLHNYRIKNEHLAMITEDVTDVVIGKDDYVDHQSRIVIPRDYQSYDYYPSVKFFNDFVKFLERDDVAVVGGNDNSDSSFTIDGKYIGFTLPKDSHDRVGFKYSSGYWVIFDTKKGTKVRFSFDSKEVTKGDWPELVDISVTDFCNNTHLPCFANCYKGSNSSGKHAGRFYIKELANTFAANGTFEFAIGGGEPTSHPDIKEIILDIKSSGIVPNMSTRNVAWLVQNAEFINGCMGGVAISVTTAEEATQAIAAITDKYSFNNYWLYAPDKAEVSLQHVIGSTDLDNLKNILDAAKHVGMRVTLLGPKKTGRGTIEWPTYDWKSVVLAKDYCNVGIDTCVAKYIGDNTLLKSGVVKELYETEEGRFSCYVDAVKMTINKSSFEEATPTVIPGEAWGRKKEYFRANEETVKTIKTAFSSY